MVVSKSSLESSDESASCRDSSSSNSGSFWECLQWLFLRVPRNLQMRVLVVEIIAIVVMVVSKSVYNGCF